MPYRFIAKLVLLFSLACRLAYAADPQAYEVTLNETTNAELNQALLDVSTLIKLKHIAPVDSFALVARAQKDKELFNTVVRSFGYYQSHITLQIADLNLDDVKLNELLEHTAANQSVEVKVLIELGSLFHIRHLQINGDVPRPILDKLSLKAGAPAKANDVLAARENLLQALQAEGYALAKVDEPIAYQVPDNPLLDITFQASAGKQVELGDIQFKGLAHVHEDFVRKRLLIKSGERFNPLAIEKARQDLSSLGVFSSVRASIEKKRDAKQQLGIAYEVTERPRRALTLGASYFTDLGGSLSASWLHRNLLGNAEQLALNSAITQIAGNSTVGIGYNVSASFMKPDFLHRDQVLQTDLRAIKQHLLAYNQTAVIADVSLTRRFSEHWSLGVGLAGEQSQITQAGTTYNYTLLSVPALLKYDTSNSLLDPTRGIRASLTLTPTQPLAGQLGKIFFQSQLSASTYLDLTGSGRSVLALRGLVMDTKGVDRFGLPPDKRAYAGGSATVRGYTYQSIGPRFSDNKPQGGTAMSSGTVEFRQRFLQDWGAVLFVDAGQVSVGGAPFTSTWHLGAGAGVRYYTSFGPIRIDVALPLNPQADSGSFQLYASLGQAF